MTEQEQENWVHGESVFRASVFEAIQAVYTLMANSKLTMRIIVSGPKRYEPQEPYVVEVFGSDSKVSDMIAVFDQIEVYAGISITPVYKSPF